MQDAPIVMEPRLITSHKFKDYMIALFEMPDLTVDYPYVIVIESQNKRIGVGQTIMSRTNQIEAKLLMEAQLRSYLRVNGLEQIAS